MDLKKTYMKRSVILGVVALTLSVLMSACNIGGPPAALTKFDEKIGINMTLDQVNAMLTPELKTMSTLYQANDAKREANGSWSLSTKDGGFKTGETGAFQVLFFAPAKNGGSYYAVFFKDKVVIGKSWFSSTGGAFIERLLKGEKIYSS